MGINSVDENLQSWPTSHIMTPARGGQESMRCTCAREKQGGARTITCALINCRLHFRSDGCHPVESPNLIFLLQSDHVRILLRRPLLNDVLR